MRKINFKIPIKPLIYRFDNFTENCCPGCIILLDDARARKIASRLEIKQIGTIGLLLRAKRRGMIDKIKPHIDALVENGIYIRQVLIDAVLKDAGE